MYDLLALVALAAAVEFVALPWLKTYYAGYFGVGA